MDVLQHIRFRMSLWLRAKLIPYSIRGKDLIPILERARPPTRSPYLGLTARHIAKRVKRACRNPWLMRDRPCLREGLLVYRFLAMAGYRPVLRFGVDRTTLTAASLSAHCWVEIDGKPVLNPPSPGMVEVLVYDHGSQRMPRRPANHPAVPLEGRVG